MATVELGEAAQPFRRSCGKQRQKGKTMQIEISRLDSNAQRVLVGTWDSYAEAKHDAARLFEILHFEADPDFVDCADFFTSSGAVYAIQPKGFAL